MTITTYEDMNIILTKKKKDLMKFLKEKKLNEDKELLDKLSDIFRYSEDTGFKLATDKMITYYENYSTLLQEQINWFKEGKIYNGFIYFVHDNENGKNSKIHFTVYNNGNLTEDLANKIQEKEGKHPAAYGFYSFKQSNDGQFYTWHCNRNSGD